MLEAKIDGFRCYKIKNRGDVCNNGRKYIAPVYVIGLPGDVNLFNKDLEYESRVIKGLEDVI